MSVKRTSVLFLFLACAAGCSGYASVKDLPIDCSVENAYVFNPTPVDVSKSFPAPDPSVGATFTTTVDSIPGGSLCGAPTAFVIKAHHNNDWGGLAGFYIFGPRDESAYEGLSFWGRAPGPTTKGFTVVLDDANTSSPPDAGTNCVNYGSDGGTGAIYDSTGMLISGATSAAPPPDACGNGYTTTMVVTGDWRFYTIPFDRFHQGALPNRVPNDALPGTGMLTDKLMGLTFRLPKEAEMDLWMTKVGFYRKKGADAGSDATGG